MDDYINQFNRLQKKAKKYMKLFPDVKKLKIYPSNRDNKRLIAQFEINDIIKSVHFGDPTAVTYFDYPDKKKRGSFQKRHSKIKLKSGDYAYLTAGTPASFAYFILW